MTGRREHRDSDRPPAGMPAGPPGAVPLVSVVMPVYNAAEYLDESIESILGQTFSDFEFLILDDGSTDGSLALLRQWEARDSRIRVFESPVNLGVVTSSNTIVSQASTPFIARMDADDIAHPDRLRRQLRILQDESEVMLVGTLWDGIDSEGRPVRPRDRWRLAFRSKQAPFPHGSVMFRRASFGEIGGYRAECAYWEDLDLYLRMQGRGRVVAIPDTLYHYRFHANSARAVTPADDLISSIALMRRCHAAYVSTASYESVLAGHRPAEGARVPPAVLNSITSAHLWAGLPPGALRLLLRRGDLTWNRSTLAAILMAAWGAASPRSLRFFLRRLIEFRDLAAGPRLRKKAFVDWRSR